jgi:GT2 family glycosyltransferase
MPRSSVGKTPLLSVVICTHERPADLARCLVALARLEDPVEVIVVDSASQPPCRELVAPPARYVYVGEPGLSRARNAGVEVASCELIAFVDDDAAVTPDWARRLASAFERKDVGAVGGTCRAAFESPRPAWLSDRLLQYAGITRFGAREREARSSAEYPFGANLCVRRRALEEVCGFTESLGRIGTLLLSGEEAAVLDAMRSSGWRIWLRPDAVVEHTVASGRCRSGYYWRRLWWQGRSRARAQRSWRVAFRVVLGAPVRLGLWLFTRDRVYLYRLAETTGYVRERFALRSDAHP